MNQALLDAQRWTSYLASARATDPLVSLRHPDTKPPRPLVDYDGEHWSVLEHASLNDFLAGHLARRQVALSLHSPPPCAIDQGGRVLVFYPSQTLSDGAAQADSKGFFTVDNEPPWDTWFSYIPPVGLAREAVACWIPSAFIHYAEEGINVNPEVCIRWATPAEIRAFDAAPIWV